MCAAVLSLAVFGLVTQVRLAGAVPEIGGLAPLIAGVLAAIAAMVACGCGRAGRVVSGKGRWIAFGVAAALMAALIIFGRRYRGGLYLPGRLNPSELVKLCVVATLAGWIGSPSQTVKGLVLCGILFSGADEEHRTQGLTIENVTLFGEKVDEKSPIIHIGDFIDDVTVQ